MVFIIPLLGHLYKFIRQPVGFVSVVIIPAIYIIISELIKIKKIVETEAVRKYEFTQKNKKTPPMISLFFVLGLTLYYSHIATTLSYFSSGRTMASSFSTGIWTNPSLSVSLDRVNHRIRFTGSHLDAKDYDYEIIYQNDIDLQGFAGTIKLENIIDGEISRDFYLGTCTSGGTCVSDNIAVGSTISITLGSLSKSITY
jgi:hypothetical protein